MIYYGIRQPGGTISLNAYFTILHKLARRWKQGVFGSWEYHPVKNTLR